MRALSIESLSRPCAACIVATSLALGGCAAPLAGAMLGMTLGSAARSIAGSKPCRQPTFPAEARRQGIDEGYVRAVLRVDAMGKVGDIELLESSSPVFIEEARDFFASYRYGPGEAGRLAEETLRFRRLGNSPCAPSSP